MNSNPRKSNRPLLPNHDNSPTPDSTTKCSHPTIPDNPRNFCDILPETHPTQQEYPTFPPRRLKNDEAFNSLSIPELNIELDKNCKSLLM